MSGINDSFSDHLICSLYQERQKGFILEKYSHWVSENNFYDWHLVLSSFASVEPLIYCNTETVNSLLSLLDSHKTLTFYALSVLSKELTHAVLSIFREGNSWNNYDPLALDNPHNIADFENIWHPEYQRYCEHIYNHLIQIPLYIIGETKQKNYLSTALSNRVSVLGDNNLDSLTKGFSSTVRNAISHGSVTFESSMITYTDRNKNITLFPREFAMLFDELVDNCHSLLISILLFICNNRLESIKGGLENLPLGILFLFIKSFSSHGDFEVKSMIESQTVESKRQLNIYVKTTSLSRTTQMFDSMNAAWHTSQFGGDSYNRIAVMLDCGKSVAPAIFINGDRLREAILNNEPTEKCISQIIEASLLWFDSPNFLRKLHFWKNIAISALDNFKLQLRKERHKRGLKTLSALYDVKHVQNKSTETIPRIEAQVVLKGKLETIMTLKENGEIRCALIEDIVRHATTKLKKHKISLVGIKGEHWIKHSPQYIWIRLYSKNARLRSLLSYSWQENFLIARAEWFSKWRNLKPIFLMKPNASVAGILIEYNPSLKAAGASVVPEETV